jgi:hypothetical protein
MIKTKVQQSVREPAGYDVAYFRHVSTRHDNLLTNDKVIFLIMLTYSYMLTTTFVRYTFSFDIINVDF